MKFSHLHNHTMFSLLDGASDISRLFKKAVADEMPALAITDHGNMFGAFQFVAEAYKHKNADGTPKIKPVVGCEFYIVSDMYRKNFTREEKDVRYHQVLLAKNEIGYKNLVKMVPALMKKYHGAPQYPASYGLGNDFPVEMMK